MIQSLASLCGPQGELWKWDGSSALSQVGVKGLDLWTPGWRMPLQVGET